jgi:hypothetical protein
MGLIGFRILSEVCEERASEGGSDEAFFLSRAQSLEYKALFCFLISCIAAFFGV